VAKVRSVHYDEPVDGYPTAYALDDVPKIESYADGQTVRGGDLVGVLLRGAPCEIDAARVACELAGSRRFALIAILARPFLYSYGARNAGLDPEAVALEIKMEQRRRLRELLERAGLETQYSISVVRRPSLPRALSYASQAGCGALITTGRGFGIERRASRLLARWLGLDLITVPSRARRE